MKYVRLYTGLDGESHFEDVEMDLTAGIGYGTGATETAQQGPDGIRSHGHGDPHLATGRIQTNGAIIRSYPPGFFADWHPSPWRALIVTLRGAMELTASDGETRRFGPGEWRINDDRTGKGHQARSVGDAGHDTLLIYLPDEG